VRLRTAWRPPSRSITGRGTIADDTGGTIVITTAITTDTGAERRRDERLSSILK
jgi:hypothetical protein